MTDTVAVVAVTNVTFDGRRYRPGAAFELPAPCAHALAAAGNVRYADTGRPDGGSGGTGEGGGRPAAGPSVQTSAEGVPPAAPPEPPPAVAPPRDRRPGRSHADTGGIALETVSGIGPATAERLRLAGIADVAELAAVEDAELDELRIRAYWRDRARALAGD